MVISLNLKWGNESFSYENSWLALMVHIFPELWDQNNNSTSCQDISKQTTPSLLEGLSGCQGSQGLKKPFKMDKAGCALKIYFRHKDIAEGLLSWGLWTQARWQHKSCTVFIIKTLQTEHPEITSQEALGYCLSSSQLIILNRKRTSSHTHIFE